MAAVNNQASRVFAIALVLLIIVLGFRFVDSVTASTLVWSATFESGSWYTYFDAGMQTSCGAVNSISHRLSFIGKYAGYYYHFGGKCSENIRAYPHEELQTTLTKFRLQVMVYVPSVTLLDWVSFMTMHLTDGTFITIDSTGQVLHMWDGALQEGSRTIQQLNPISWPFNRWFNLTVVANLKPGADNSHIVLYQNSVKVIDYTGYAGNGSLRLMHFGLYTGSTQATFNVYNDEIRLWQL